MRTEKQEMLPAIYGEKLPEIPQETLDRLLKTSEQNTILASVKKDGGFEAKNSWFESLTGVIVSIDPYLVKWERKEPHKLPYIEDELDWPQDYKPGCDLTIFTSERVRIKFSLSKSSFQYELCDYIKFLDLRGLKPHQVLTKFTTRQVHGQFGEYTVVVPHLVSENESDGVVDLSAPQPVEEPEVDPMPGGEDDIPF
jgi:hypothetical protein